MTLLIKKVSSLEDKQHCFNIRHQVFVEGQNVPPHEEIDGKDDESTHYLLWVDSIPVGVARVRFIDKYAKIERVAILDAYQGKKLGYALMEFILADLNKNLDLKYAKLSSQTYAIPFYEKLGFVVCGEEYMDAGIPHKNMKKNIDK